MESEQPPKKLAPAEYAEMVKMKLRNTYPNCLNPMSERVIDSLNNLLAKSAVKLKNEQLEEQFKADLINKQLKAFDDLWQNLGLTESLTELKKRMQDRPKSSALKSVPSSDDVYEQVQPNRIKALKFRMTTLEEKVKEQQNALRVIFDDVEQKRENYDSIMKRREKLIEVMKTKDIEMNVSLDGLKGRRSFALKTDLMDA